MNLEVMKEQLIGKNKRIVFPEGDDLRIIEAASNLYKVFFTSATFF